jgi:hypothetical protein
MLFAYIVIFLRSSIFALSDVVSFLFTYFLGFFIANNAIQ